ncbi:hypothetical protein [Streptomyces sp. NPDC058620]|uniref:hypothetical protein n=1 Tax=Streptomyces sp. NPDC058620 TaxID=3346560 RepID=UPI00366284EB
MPGSVEGVLVGDEEVSVAGDGRGGLEGEDLAAGGAQALMVVRIPASAGARLWSTSHWLAPDGVPSESRNWPPGREVTLLAKSSAG